MKALADLVANWDLEFNAGLDVRATAKERSPYEKVLKSLKGVRAFRFEGYRNDALPNFIAKLTHWIGQFESDERAVAFLLASRFVFITPAQFDALLRRLFRSHVRRHFVEHVIARSGLPRFHYADAAGQLAAEMDRTIFVPNSDSSPLNAFAHINGDNFADRERRALVGPELAFWTYPALVGAAGDPRLARAAKNFEMRAIREHPKLNGKYRLVLLEDFSGTGSDLRKSISALHRSDLDVSEVGVAVVISTQAATERLTKLCADLTGTGKRQYFFWTAHVLPHRLRCFDGPEPSYLDATGPIANLSQRVKSVSERLYIQRFHRILDPEDQHGFGRLALAFATHSNCPDNSLPFIWSTHDGWLALYPRVSRII